MQFIQVGTIMFNVAHILTVRRNGATVDILTTDGSIHTFSGTDADSVWLAALLRAESVSTGG